jgi:ABC-type lipoprotein export system ATPase subunit
MITHEDEVAAHADRLVRLADGLVVSDLPVRDDEVTRHAPLLARSA